MKTNDTVYADSAGSFLVVQWLGFRAFTAVAWVQSLVRELRSHKVHDAAKTNKQAMLRLQNFRAKKVSQILGSEVRGVSEQEQSYPELGLSSIKWPICTETSGFLVSLGGFGWIDGEKYIFYASKNQHLLLLLLLKAICFLFFKDQGM